MAAGPREGWYGDPEDRSRLRWWDGSRWTEHTHEPPAEAAGATASPAPGREEDEEDSGRKAQELLAMEVPSATDAGAPARRLLPWLIGGIILLLALCATAIILDSSSAENELPVATTPPLDPEAEAADGRAQEQARTAQTAIETYAVDHGGSYQDATAEELVAIAPTLAGAALSVQPAADNYSLSIDSASGNTFTITRDTAGAVTFTCGEPAAGGCPAGGFWG